MAEDTPTPADGAPRAPTFDEKDKKKARAWFKKAADERDRRAYDYAIECYISGLAFWPEAVEEGHAPLHALSHQRHASGGKKAGMMEAMKRSTSGKDAQKAMLNAEFLLAKDPGNGSYIDALLKNAVKANLLDTAQWVTPLVADSLRADKKPNASRFKSFRETLVAASEASDSFGAPEKMVFFLEKALDSLDYLLGRNPGDMTLRDEQRYLSGKLTIAKGKYETGDSFRDSLRDADSQKLLHDEERTQHAGGARDAVIESARVEHEADPTNATKLNKYIEALTKSENDESENIAIKVLESAAEQLDNYSYKARADDLRLRQVGRARRLMQKQTRDSGSTEDAQQLRLMISEELDLQVKIFEERVKKYPTDLRMKFRLGQAYFNQKRYDDAIPLLQAAQNDPRSRSASRMLIGRAFLGAGSADEAAEVLRDALDDAGGSDDDDAKQLMYWLGRAYQEAGKSAEAREVLGKLVRIDYNFANGDARKRLETVK